MEERMIKRDESREVKLTERGGETDAVDALAPEETVREEPAEEAVVSLPDDYDEDLVGLTPTQLKEELERRERAKKAADAEYARLLSEGEARLGEGDYRGAEAFFLQASVYRDDPRAEEGVWAARTENYTSSACFFQKGVAQKFAEASEGARESLLGRMRESLKEELAECEREAEPIRARVEEGMQSRRGAFRANRRYYLVRFLAVLGCLAAFAVGCGVSAFFIPRTLSSAPVVLAAVFGGLSFAVLCVLVYFSRKLYVAVRLCSDNEKLSSTEEGTRLKELDARASALRTVLGDA